MHTRQSTLRRCQYWKGWPCQITDLGISLWIGAEGVRGGLKKLDRIPPVLLRAASRVKCVFAITGEALGNLTVLERRKGLVGERPLLGSLEDMLLRLLATARPGDAMILPAQVVDWDAARGGRCRARERRVCGAVGRAAFSASLSRRRPPDGDFLDDSFRLGPSVDVVIAPVVGDGIDLLHPSWAAVPTVSTSRSGLVLGTLRTYLLRHALVVDATLGLGPVVVGDSLGSQVIDVELGLAACVVGSLAFSPFALGGRGVGVVARPVAAAVSSLAVVVVVAMVAVVVVGVGRLGVVFVVVRGLGAVAAVPRHGQGAQGLYRQRGSRLARSQARAGSQAALQLGGRASGERGGWSRWAAASDSEQRTASSARGLAQGEAQRAGGRQGRRLTTCTGQAFGGEWPSRAVDGRNGASGQPETLVIRPWAGPWAGCPPPAPQHPNAPASPIRTRQGTSERGQ